jgi:hypothetical protein
MGIVLYEKFIITLCCEIIPLFTIIMLFGMSFVLKKLGGLLNCVPFVDTLEHAHTLWLIS